MKRCRTISHLKSHEGSTFHSICSLTSRRSCSLVAPTCMKTQVHIQVDSFDEFCECFIDRFEQKVKEEKVVVEEFIVGEFNVVSALKNDECVENFRDDSLDIHAIMEDKVVHEEHDKFISLNPILDSSNDHFKPNVYFDVSSGPNTNDGFSNVPLEDGHGRGKGDYISKFSLDGHSYHFIDEISRGFGFGFQIEPMGRMLMKILVLQEDEE